MDDLTLTGRVAVVTGGSRGIGRPIALALARRGAAVAICYRERTDAGLETASLVREQGVSAFAGQCDVADANCPMTVFALNWAAHLGRANSR